MIYVCAFLVLRSTHRHSRRGKKEKKRKKMKKQGRKVRENEGSDVAGEGVQIIRYIIVLVSD